LLERKNDGIKFRDSTCCLEMFPTDIGGAWMKPLTPEEMAEDFEKFAAKDGTSPASRRYRYEQGITVQTPQPEELPEEPVATPPVQMVSVDTMYTWICTSCGVKMTDKSVGKIFPSRFHFNQLLTAQCTSCGGVARHIRQLRESTIQEDGLQYREDRQRRTGWWATGGTLLILLVLPAMAEFNIFLGTVLWVGPLKNLALRSKLPIIMIAGLCTNFLSSFGLFYPYGNWLSTLLVFLGFAVLTLIIGLALNAAIQKISSFGLFSTRRDVSDT
jgi:hypothetical protein